ncbi:hypothetical protein BUALT_Bualt13G0103300 [Buddleja alternifolia]|uniref:NAB domain-containing protein n=1 Tax=Buddleja alternifolia TaxID=168488 RepID=A0AAV6WRT0_9LAMI|nr:hypothetical protein BUALT_Bualt13G0103300 [Buddleja alternifolia]
MASPYSNKLNRSESKKSHSWWWDSHISPKNSKWLQDNLEEMDQHVKRMLKLIEEDADSFARKAEIYFKKRPELISLVEEFYRIYRSLAERYDHLTGELRKNILSDIQSQCSGISDPGSEPPSTIPSPDPRPNRTKSGPRAAGFDFFLGTGSNLNKKEGDESSTMDSESESDNSSVNNYNNGDEQGLQKKIIELEAELQEVKSNYEDSKVKENYEDSKVSAKIATYEEELRVANEKIRLSDDEIIRLTIELQKYKSLKDSYNLDSKNLLASAHKIRGLEEELRVTQEKLNNSEVEVARLKHEFRSKKNMHKSAENEGSIIIMVKREVSKLLQHRMGPRYKNNHPNRDQDNRGLKQILLL